MGSGISHHKKVVAGDQSKYGSGPAYWDMRYTNESGKQFDWFQRYGHPSENLELRKVIREIIPENAYILNLGASVLCICLIPIGRIGANPI